MIATDYYVNEALLYCGDPEPRIRNIRIRKKLNENAGLVCVQCENVQVLVGFDK